MEKKERKDLEWVWQKKPIKLHDLEDAQLHVVRNALNMTTKKIWFNVDRKVWLKEVNNLITIRSNHNINIMSEHIKNRRLKKSLKFAEELSDFIINLAINPKRDKK